MDIILRTGFQKITHSIEWRPETIGKAKKLLEAEGVENVKEFITVQNSKIISGEVMSQVSTSKIHYVSLRLDANRHVQGTNCDCINKNSEKCRHVAALIEYVNCEGSLSKTNFQKQWGTPNFKQYNQAKYAKGEYFEIIFPFNFIEEDSIPPKLEELQESPLKMLLASRDKNQEDLAMEYFLKTAEKNISINIKKQECQKILKEMYKSCMSHNIYTQDPRFNDADLMTFFIEKIFLCTEEVIELCCDTIGQSMCKRWFLERALRISSSSNVYSICSRKSKTEESLVQDMLYAKDINLSSCKYGKDNESKARKIYEENFNVQVKEIGVLVSFAQPWICASVDGVVFKEGCVTKLVEIKCPSSCKEKPIIDLSKKVDKEKSNVPYFEYKNNTVNIKKNTKYYHQIQMQMYVSGLDECDIFVYSPVGSCCLTVERDEEFIKNAVLKCEKFYFESLLPGLKEKYDNNNNNINIANNESEARRPLATLNV